VGVALDDAVAGIDGATPAFGRLEEVQVRDKHVVLTLAKNPASLAQAAEAAVARRPDALLIGLSDLPADGRDVSWIWDAAIERLRCIPSLTLTGSRADDLLLRFKYASDVRIPTGARSPIEVDPEVDTAFDAALERVRPGGTLMVLATYTALLGIRGLLERRGAAPVLPR
jgi:UDP-N-acetylmuramyl tripeptide synthase